MRKSEGLLVPHISSFSSYF